eukprot:6288981-Amphidinium_carterae.1
MSSGDKFNSPFAFSYLESDLQQFGQDVATTATLAVTSNDSNVKTNNEQTATSRAKSKEKTADYNRKQKTATSATISTIPGRHLSLF